MSIYKTELLEKNIVDKKKINDKSTKRIVRKKRYFRILDDDGTMHGRFAGSKSKEAANKAFTSIVRKRAQNGESTEEKINFSLKECTRNCKPSKRIYQYIGERKELDQPHTVTINKNNGEKRTIIYKYCNKVSRKKTP